MDKFKDLKNIFWLISSSLIILTSIILGLTLKESVFFSYDMPRVALKVQEYLESGSYMTSQYFFSESSWLNVAWGPALIFFYALLIKISPDPIIVSYLLTLLNSVAILAIIAAGWRNFSPKVGVIAGAFLALNPYLFTYSRIIYQPSPLTFFIPISIYFYFEAIKHKSYALVLLPILWVIMFQIYIPIFSFILVSILFLLFYLKRQDYKFMILGILMSMIFMFPSFVFYKENPIYISRFFEAPSHFNPREKEFIERGKNVLDSFVKIPIGGMFKWQTGNSYKDFVSQKIPVYEKASSILVLFFVLSLVFEVYISIKNKDAKRGVVVAWTSCALWYLNILWTIDLVPRYFLLSIPPAMLLISIFINDIFVSFGKNIYLKLIIYFLPLTISLYWLLFNIYYNDFIKNYNFPYGWFSDIAETPYIYIKNSIDFVINDSIKNNCTPVVSNDIENPNFVLWMETEYPWKYIYKEKIDINIEGEKCHYLISHISTFRNNENFVKYEQMGPFGVSRND